MFELYPYQDPIAGKVFKYLTDNPGKHPLVAAPTGSGKTVILADIVLKTISKWPEVNILVLSHVREILEQDYRSLTFHTKMDIGIYSAGLGKRELKQVTVAGIQSVYRKPELFRDYKFIIIDECHLIPPASNSMYKRFFKGLNNPRYLGLTATPFRLGSGYIYGEKDSLFDDLVVDLTKMEQFNKLIKDGFLCNLKTMPTNIELETEGVKTVGGDFDNKELAEINDVEFITKAAITEIILKGKDYKKWLIFAIDIKHAENIAEELGQHGIPTMVIHSKMDFDRATVINHYKLGTFRCIVNVNILTTGFDDPRIDLIAMLRPTKSPVVHIQTIGRGLRIAPQKDHCLILDFAGNTERLGPINDVRIRKKAKSKKGGDEPITKRCPDCNAIHHPTKKICEFCGHVFKFKTLLQKTSGKQEIIAHEKPAWLKVLGINYKLHVKKNTPSMMLVEYQCGLRTYKEYICIEHPGAIGIMHKHWAKYRGLPDIETSINLVHRSKELKTPDMIKVDRKGKYPYISDYTFSE